MKLVEVYTSVQGEGPNVGYPIQFVRFGGCNYRCPGWPCDTQFAIDPQFKDKWISYTPAEVLEQVAEWPPRVCITGGEPLIQPSREMEQFAYGLPGYFRVDLFTNGSRLLPDWVFTRPTTVVMDWKLAGSGETPDQGIRLQVARQLQADDAIKFVCKDRDDLLEAVQATADLYTRGVRAQLFAGVVWGELEDSDLVEFICQQSLPWRLNVQVHNHIWNPQERRR